ncbi:MAG: polymer-forming cytoskeletal protein [candidate division Zixibacteria bacterium]|nr:polymer-forming cytoskeletal protein [candidate division Zixibacteria bacterium]
MKRTAQYIYLAMFIFGLFMILIPMSAQAQANEEPNSDQPSESVVGNTFTDIELSPEGVIAFDSADNKWIYDFELEQFVEDDRDQDETGGQRETGSREERVDPVEVRCVEEKIVDLPALRAVYVGRDEYVDGDVLASGRVTIKGWVKGRVQSFNKTVLVTATGQVDGDIKAPEVVIKPGGVVLGEVVESPRLDIPIDRFDDQLATEGIWVVFAFTLTLTLIVFLTSSLVPRKMTNLTDCVCQYPVRSFLLGFLFLILMPAIVLLVAVTIVGILVVWLVPIAYLVALALGMGISGFQITGPLMRRHFGMNLGSVAISLSGVLMYMVAWAVVALLLGSDRDGSSGYHGLGVFMLVISILGTIYPFMTGIGAAVLTRFGFRPYVGSAEAQAQTTEAAPVPAPPPIPEGPAPVRRPLPPPEPPKED